RREHALELSGREVLGLLRFERDRNGEKLALFDVVLLVERERHAVHGAFGVHLVMAGIDREALREIFRRDRTIVEGHREIADARRRREGDVRDLLHELLHALGGDLLERLVVFLDAELERLRRVTERVDQFARLLLAESEVKARSWLILELERF